LAAHRHKPPNRLFATYLEEQSSTRCAAPELSDCPSKRTASSNLRRCFDLNGARNLFYRFLAPFFYVRFASVRAVRGAVRRQNTVSMMNKLLFASATLFMAANVHTCANAAKWQWKLPIAAAKSALQVEVCPLKYGKTWAYSFEIDDGPASTLAVSQPLLARYQWNDAPPGVAGGTLRPFVGGAAVILGSINTGNSTGLTYEQLDQLKKSGWSFLDHSYWHSGNHWDPANFLKPEDFKRELFWSQTIFAELLNDGRGATHFVFPNGDYHYGPYLEAYGLRSATRVGGSSPHNLRDSKLNFLDFNRNYLDESVWSQQNNALSDLPAQPQAGDFIIDFTHGMDGDAQSANNKR